MPVEKSVKIVEKFSNGLRNGGGSITYDSATGEVEIFYSSSSYILCSLDTAENISDAIRKVIQVASDHGIDHRMKK